jgi:hypothetical protein
MKNNDYCSRAVLLFSGVVVRVILHKTEILAADFERKLIADAFRWLFKGDTKMKTVFSALNGAVVLTETAGVFTLSLSEALSVGGGHAAGLLKVQGTGSVVFDAPTGAKLGLALVNSHLPAALQPLAAEVEAIAEAAVVAAE